MRLKISDGDLIIVVMGGELQQPQLNTVRDRYVKWVSERGLQGVEVVVYSNLDAKGFDIKVLSVNDIVDGAINGN